MERVERRGGGGDREGRADMGLVRSSWEEAEVEEVVEVVVEEVVETVMDAADEALEDSEERMEAGGGREGDVDEGWTRKVEEECNADDDDDEEEEDDEEEDIDEYEVGADKEDEVSRGLSWGRDSDSVTTVVGGAGTSWK